MNIDQKNIHQEIQKRLSHKFVQQNYDDIFQQTYLVLLEGENDCEKAVERAIFQTKRAITNPKLKNHKFVSIGEGFDLAEPEVKKAVFWKTPFNDRKKRRIYDQITDIEFVGAILVDQDYSFSNFVSKGNIPTIQLQEPCPICSNKKCFAIFDNGEDIHNNKDRYTYYCYSENPDYKNYPNNLDGIFSLLLNVKRTTARKKVAKIIQEL